MQAGGKRLREKAVGDASSDPQRWMDVCPKDRPETGKSCVFRICAAGRALLLPKKRQSEAARAVQDILQGATRRQFAGKV